MSELKTKPTGADVAAYLNRVADERKRADCFHVLELMQEITGEKPEMWGDSIVGFGRYRYRYASGRQAEWMLTGFAPRKQALTLYIMSGFDAYDDLLNRLGKFKTGKSCLYIKRLADVDLDVLRELIRQSVAHMRATNEAAGGR
ncbi:MAG: DUF1801 domain-containing protein [Caldilineae bacterium]|nr:MAG: DUF1801 domain-containing protein [Caldilineae bacterium]